MELKYDSGAAVSTFSLTDTVRSSAGSFIRSNTYSSQYVTSQKVVYGENIANAQAKLRNRVLMGATEYKSSELQTLLTKTVTPPRSTASDGSYVQHQGTILWFPGRYNIYASEDDVTSVLASSGALGKLDELIESATAKCVAGYDVGTALAELAPTLAAFGKVGASLRALLAAIFAKDEPYDLIFKPLHASNVWLELRYQWRTLIADVKQLSEALASISKPKFPRQRNRAGASFAKTLTKTLSGSHWWGPWTASTRTDVNINVRGNAIFECENSGFFINPVVTAWQLTRLSFVIDWFANVTRWLQAWTTELLYDGYTWGSYRATVRHTSAFTFTGNANGNTTSPPFSEAFESTLVLNCRFPSGLSAFPSGLRCDLSNFQVIDMVALFLQWVYSKIGRLSRF